MPPTYLYISRHLTIIIRIILVDGWIFAYFLYIQYVFAHNLPVSALSGVVVDDKNIAIICYHVQCFPLVRCMSIIFLVLGRYHKSAGM